jgi:hypothetical protein
MDYNDPKHRNWSLSWASFGLAWIPLMPKQLSDIVNWSDLEKVSFSYTNSAGIAPDALSAYIPFGYKSLFLSIIAYGDIVIDFTTAGTDPYVVYDSKGKRIYRLEVEGFRIRNLIPGSNIPYQIVAYR